MGRLTGPPVVAGDPEARREVEPGRQCICPSWPFCDWKTCRSDCPANDCTSLGFIGGEREARWADTGQGEAPVDAKLGGDHTGHNAFQQRSAS